ncbi:NADPH-dependent FMN reductase [Flavisolibacter ginsenosidimutans]|uniref:NAD(P)H-dependent oxidoreductase n=1 Tax=Flavisolibacter ginsenosidimutans TaxID=661481 RepID=A0A5B8UG19_9BACT|nr:NADPH-dependent FMN reductase [Flavisolibacter ginsenosidimutans]QEC55544.1 NAD(P)H-dependent oxidoreductase [Flavisolibacter ginsenosidimutans]
MYNIALVSSSVRIGRNSQRVALFLNNYIKENNLATVDLIDLCEYKFPVFDERLRYMKDPPANVLQFAERIIKAEGVIVVTPEYNGGYPAALKNAIDLLYPEWKRKPVGLSTVSAGSFGGAQVGPSLAFLFVRIGALVTPAVFRVPTVQNSYDENGVPVDKEASDRRAKTFLDEFFWLVEARKRMSD